MRAILFLVLLLPTLSQAAHTHNGLLLSLDELPEEIGGLMELLPSDMLLNILSEKKTDLERRASDGKGGWVGQRFFSFKNLVKVRLLTLQDKHKQLLSRYRLVSIRRKVY